MSGGRHAAADAGAGDEEIVARELALRIRNGDTSAERQVVERYRRGLVVLLRHWTRDAALAEDLAQDSFLIVLERLRDTGLAEPGKLQAFLRRTAHNLATAEQRKQARRRTHNAGDLLPDAPHDVPDQAQALEMAEETALVRRLIAELDQPRDREVLYRHHVLEEDKARICADLGLDAVQFNCVLHRARQRFRALWERARQEEG